MINNKYTIPNYPLVIQGEYSLLLDVASVWIEADSVEGLLSCLTELMQSHTVESSSPDGRESGSPKKDT